VVVQIATVLKLRFSMSVWKYWTGDSADSYSVVGEG
jgi:hypothetical protein